MAVLLALAVLLGCAAPVTAGGEPRGSSIRMAPGGADDPVSAIRRFKPLTDHLSRELGRPVELVLRGTYQEILEGFGRDEVDVVFGNAITFVDAKRLHGGRALVKRVRGGATTYTSVFVVGTSSRAERLDDLRSTRIAFSDPSSTTGYAMPRLMLARIGAADPATFFAEVKFKGNQRDAVRAVLAGEVHVAVVASFVLRDLPADAPALRILARSEPMEMGPVFVNPRTLNPDTLAALRTAFVAIGRTAQTMPVAEALRVDGFVAAADRDYRQIEEIHAAVQRLPAVRYREAPEVAVPRIVEAEPAPSGTRERFIVVAVLGVALLVLVARPRVWEGLRGAFLLSFFGVVVVLLGLVTAATYVNGRELVRISTRDSAVLLSQSVLLASRRAIVTDDRTFLQPYADALVRQRSVPVTSVAFADRRGRVLSGSGRFEGAEARETGDLRIGDTIVRTYGGGWFGREYLAVSVPVTVESATWGEVRLVFPLERMHTLLREAILNALIIGLVAAIVGFGLADLLTRRITRPLRDLLDGARAVSRGELTWRTTVTSRDEVGELAEAFGAMTRSLQSHIDDRIRSERLALLGTLAAGIAHEVRNPLDAIKGAAQVIQTQTAADETARRFTRIIQEEVTALNRFLTQFLELARPAPLERRPVAAGDVVREALGLLGPVLAENAIKVDLDLAGDVAPVPADAAQIKQVVLNLCLNAVQTMAGGGTLRISTGMSTVEGQPGVQLRVQDTGPGVPEALRARIFEPFVSTKDGTGLGLAVSRGIVDRHRGRIWLVSERGRDTTFCVWLPAG